MRIREAGAAAAGCVALLLGLLAPAAGCGGPPGEEPPGERTDTNEREPVVDERADSRPTIRDVMEAHRHEWMARPDVSGMGIGRCDGEPCIVLYLRRRTEALASVLPETIEGYPVRLEVTGGFEARPPPGDTGETGG